MRGEVLTYDDGIGSGLIGGDDGGRYEFRRSDLQQLRPLSPGMKVDFVANGTAATQIFVLGQQFGHAGEPLESTNEDLSLWGYFAKCMAKSFDGDGRARRKEYWSFVLFQLLFLMLPILGIALAGAASYEGFNSDEPPPLAILMMVALGILCLVFIPASITVMLRRLHDVGLTGWWYLTIFIPYLGGLFLFIISLIPSERRVNKHGPYPKSIAP